MFTSLDVFKMAHAMAVHAGHRQALVAENIANSDTPGFRAKDLADFSDIHAGGATGHIPRATRDTHLFGASASTTANPIEIRKNPVANGNTVSLEEQLLTSVEVKRQHDRALAIYKSSLSILRTSISRQA